MLTKNGIQIHLPQVFINSLSLSISACFDPPHTGPSDEGESEWDGEWGVAWDAPWWCWMWWGEGVGCPHQARLTRLREPGTPHSGEYGGLLWRNLILNAGIQTLLRATHNHLNFLENVIRAELLWKIVSLNVESSDWRADLTPRIGHCALWEGESEQTDKSHATF